MAAHFPALQTTPSQSLQTVSKATSIRSRIVCSAETSVSNRQTQQQVRRGVLLGLASCVIVPAQKANAGFGWDGSSSAIGSCALGEEGDDCRIQTLQKATEKGFEAYGDAVKERPQQNTVGIAVAEMKDEYSKETLALGQQIQTYASMDLYNADRPKLVQLLRKDGSAWVSRYARGGSARKLSARRFYIAVDALQGHLASNGMAPFPKNKIPVLLSNVAQAEALIAQGK